MSETPRSRSPKAHYSSTGGQKNERLWTPLQTGAKIRPDRAKGSASMAHRVGVDIGGTFTDFCILDDATGAMRTLKVLSTPDSR